MSVNQQYHTFIESTNSSSISSSEVKGWWPSIEYRTDPDSYFFMAVSLNSVIGLNRTAKYQQVPGTNTRELLLNLPSISYLSGQLGLRQSIEGRRSRSYLLAANDDNVASETILKDFKTIEESYSDERPSANASELTSSAADDNSFSSDKVELTPQVSEITNGLAKPTSRRTSLTARERLRAARVLSRYTEPKSSKSGPRIKLLDALQDTGKGKRRPSLPEAPTDMLDDSKRGLSKGDWTISLPGGMDVFLIVFSFVFISSVMFATTYVVWKVGAIHFNEY